MSAALSRRLRPIAASPLSKVCPCGYCMHLLEDPDFADRLTVRWYLCMQCGRRTPETKHPWQR